MGNTPNINACFKPIGIYNDMDISNSWHIRSVAMYQAGGITILPAILEKKISSYGNGSMATNNR